MERPWKHAMALMIALASLSSTACTSCRDVVLRESPSPSSTWRSGLLARTCGSFHGYVVTVVGRDQPLAPTGTADFTAFLARTPCVVDPGAPGNRDLVTLEWLGDDELRISYPQSLRPAIASNLVGTVSVSFRTVDERFDCALGS
jgi:hypothetical protein